MRRMSRTPLPASSPMQCMRCLRLALLLPQRRQSAFLAGTHRPPHRERSPPPPSPSDITARRQLSQAAAAIDYSSAPSLNELMHWQQPAAPTPPSIPGISNDVLDRLFPRSSLWNPLEQPLLTPTINTGDPHGVQQYLLKKSAVPETTVSLLTMLNFLIGQEDLARAAMILSSLKRQVDPGTPLSTVVYNKYLEGIISSSIHNNAGFDKADRWFKEMEQDGVKHDRTTFALMVKAAFSLSSMPDGNRAARKYFQLWKKKGGEIGDLLCDLQYPQEEILRSLSLNQMSLDDVSDGYRTVLKITLRTTKQTQMILPESQPSRVRTIPSVRQTMSKSPNLEFMRQSLQCLHGEDKSEQVDQIAEGMDTSEARALAINSHDMAQQRALELGAYKSAIEVWKHQMTEAVKRGDVWTSRLGVRNLVWDWMEAMKPRLQAAIEDLRPKDTSYDGAPVRVALERQMDPQRLDLMWLTALPLETMCAITIMEVLRVFLTETHTTSHKASNMIGVIGKCIEKEIAANDLMRKENRGLLPKQFNLRQISTKRALKERFAAKFHKKLITGSEGTSAWPYEWDSEVRVRSAAVLLSSLLESALIEMSTKDENGMEQKQVAPAFYFTYAYIKGRKVGVVKANRYLSDRLAQNPTIGQGIISKQTPMLVRPKPWTSWNEGGYWYTREEVMRTRDSFEQRMYLKEACDRNQMDTVFKGLDILGETCWTINRKVFETVLSVWNSGEGLADIPPQTSELQYPPEPVASKWDVDARMKWIKECKQMSRMMQNAHSQRCDINYKMEIARAFLGKRLYFPHSLDFRGRAYPIPPHFNHLGNDLCRGLLMFYEGKPLGEHGLRWLKIHLANVYGLDKMKLEERAQFADNSLEFIFDSADKPLEGKRWWLNAEDPWQCLSTCFELAEALRSEDPTAYVCRLPIHQDGSCNGLQHYAALGGDLDGAKQVNLEPSDRPQDVYSGVAELVAADIERQALEGNDLAIALRGKVTRKIVKQTVMTNVYGVTFIGAKAQIYRALKDKGDLDPSLLAPASDLITRATFKALKDMFSGAHSIQEWLKDCAKRISKSLGPNDFLDSKPKRALPYLSPVVWTSPLGLPVCQPYRKADTHAISTVMSNFTLTKPDVLGPVDGRKQATAFPPNYIHSLDASHMLLSALACSRAGLTFASVHDSFWTHACDVDTMNSVLREAFVRMHESDLIAQLHAEFQKRYEGYYMLKPVADGEEASDEGKKTKRMEWIPLTFPPIPKKGSFEVRRLKESTYFFS